ncbi:MAG: hypothetical protein AABY27_05945 [Pseudomonadota bacterium]
MGEQKNDQAYKRTVNNIKDACDLCKNELNNTKMGVDSEGSYEHYDSDIIYSDLCMLGQNE